MGQGGAAIGIIIQGASRLAVPAHNVQRGEYGRGNLHSADLESVISGRSYGVKNEGFFITMHSKF